MNSQRQTRFSLPLVAVFTLVVLLSSAPAPAGKAYLDSAVSGASVEIDGDLADWQETMHYIEDAGLFLGAANDDEYLYVAMMSRNPDVNRSIMMSGLIVWLDPEGGSHEKTGIHFPTGMLSSGGVGSGGRPSNASEGYRIRRGRSPRRVRIHRQLPSRRFRDSDRPRRRPTAEISCDLRGSPGRRHGGERRRSLFGTARVGRGHGRESVLLHAVATARDVHGRAVTQDAGGKPTRANRRSIHSTDEPGPQCQAVQTEPPRGQDIASTY